MLPVVLTDTSSGFFVINWLKCEFSSEIKWLIITHKLFVRCDLHCYVCWKTQWLSRVKIWFSSLFHYVQSQNVQRLTTPNQIYPAVSGFYIYHCVQLGSTMSSLWSPCPGFCVRCRFFFHAAWMCLSAPRLFYQIYNIKQGYIAVWTIMEIFCDWKSSSCHFLFPSLTQPWFLKTICVFYVILAHCSTISVSLTTCLFALVTINLAEEFHKLYHVCRKLTSSYVVGMDMWEQVRFRHEALVSLVCLQGQMSTMLLGLILIGFVIYLYFGLYFVLVVVQMSLRS